MDCKAFLRMEVKPAYGCTDPAAVALAAAAAGRRTTGDIKSLHLRLSANIYKNGLHVGIPGVGGVGGMEGLTGNQLAAALGALAGDPEKGLGVLEAVPAEAVEQAGRLIRAGGVRMEVVEDVPNLYARVDVSAASGTASAVVSGRPDALTEIQENGVVVWRGKEGAGEAKESAGGYKKDLLAQDMTSLWELAGAIDQESEDFMLQGARMNQTVVEQGLARPWGLGVGYSLMEEGEGGLLLRIKAAAAAAADVRMAGGPFPVMSSGGSGNHGITAIVPATVLAEELGSSPRQLAEALMLSHLVTGYIKAHTGLLTPTCGCGVAAGLGAAAAMVRLLGGGPHDAEIAGSNTLSAVLGMICDGAKGSCAFKVSTAAGEAYLSARMAMKGRGVGSRQGLVAPSLKEMAHVIGTLSKAETSELDSKILDLMREAESGAPEQS